MKVLEILDKLNSSNAETMSRSWKYQVLSKLVMQYISRQTTLAATIINTQKSRLIQASVNIAVTATQIFEINRGATDYIFSTKIMSSTWKL